MCCAVLVVKGGEGEVNVNVDSQVCVRRRQVSRVHQISLSLSLFRNASPLRLRVPSTHQLCDSTATTATATATAVTGKVK